jgi:hypothetical protein
MRLTPIVGYRSISLRSSSGVIVQMTPSSIASAYASGMRSWPRSYMSPRIVPFSKMSRVSCLPSGVIR